MASLLWSQAISTKVLRCHAVQRARSVTLTRSRTRCWSAELRLVRRKTALTNQRMQPLSSQEGLADSKAEKPAPKLCPLQKERQSLRRPQKAAGASLRLESSAQKLSNHNI